MWEQLRQELAPHGFDMVAVSLDDSAEAARPWVDEAGVDYTNVVDRNHHVAEWFGIVNVPTAVWFDEDGAMARPPIIAPGDDRFLEFSGLPAHVHHDQLRRWVVDREPVDPTLMRRWTQPPAGDQAGARAERRLAAWLNRNGHADAAAAHFERAAQLAPDDWTIRRGSMPLQGGDPFGQEFFDFAVDWDNRGRASYSE